MLKECCSDDENREVLSCTEGAIMLIRGKKYTTVTTVEKCKICGLKHYSMDSEPISMRSKLGE